MKKNKLTIYILLLLSIGIWSIVAWRIYRSFKKELPTSQITTTEIKKTKKANTSLLLNYRDPFLGDYSRKMEKTKRKKPKSVARKQKVSPPQLDIVPDFQYKGVIRLGKEVQAIVSRNGENRMLKSKDKIGEFNIMEIKDDKLVVSRKGKKYNLQIQ